jgi:hypothetical protein
MHDPIFYENDGTKNPNKTRGKKTKKQKKKNQKKELP